MSHFQSLRKLKINEGILFATYKKVKLLWFLIFI
jgi:hypothetical protein